MAHPAIAELEIHVQHRHDTIQHPFPFEVEEPKARVGDNPQVADLHQSLDDGLVIVLDGTDAWCLQPTLITAYAVGNLHV